MIAPPFGRTIKAKRKTAPTAPTPSPSPNTRGGEHPSLPSPSIGGGAGGGGRPRYESQSDYQLIIACREGVEEAWDTLVSRYERLVYTIPRRYGLTQDEVDDVFQSVWLLLLKKLHTLRQPERVSAWLVTTARRECWKRRRGAEYQRVCAMDPSLLSEKGQVEGPEELVIRYEQQLAVRRAMQRLGDRCRRLLYLLYYEVPKPSYADIAATLNMAVGSIGAIRARCLQKLSQKLEGQ